MKTILKATLIFYEKKESYTNYFLTKEDCENAIKDRTDTELFLTPIEVNENSDEYQKALSQATPKTNDMVVDGTSS